MSLEHYDRAFKDKLSEVFENVIMAPPEKAFERSNKEGKVKLPLISVYRISNPIDFDEYNHPELFRGRRNKFIDNEGFVFTEALPTLITYQVDIWAQMREYADGIFRELVFHLYLEPYLTIKLPTGDSEEGYNFHLNLTDVETATDYEAISDRNTIHRYTLTYEVDDARLFMEGETVKHVKEIPIEYVEIPWLVENGYVNSESAD